MFLLKESFFQALQALINHRFRAALTMLGIAWGIVTVVLLMAYGNGFHRALSYSFRGAFSSGTVVIWAGQTSMQAGGERAGRHIKLKLEDVDALRDLGLVKYVSPELVQDLPVAFYNRQISVMVRGVLPEYAIMRNETSSIGRFINIEDNNRRRRVVFLGGEVARKLFGNSPVVGESIRIKGISFEVIGLMADKVQLADYYAPDRLCMFIPYSTAEQLWGMESLSNIVFQSLDIYQQEEAVRQVRGVLADQHKFNPRDERALILFDTTKLNKMLGSITNGLRLILGIIGAITLMIGGVGVMNIMLVSVTERTREIGTRKALGARRRDIMLQFLLEALAITCCGGLLGMGFSYAIVNMIKTRPFLSELLNDSSRQTDVHLLLSGDLLLTAAGILMLVGLGSGLWPAWRAAKVSPIESLRYE